jgi:hypothetical protein
VEAVEFDGGGPGQPGDDGVTIVELVFVEASVSQV